MDALVEDIAQCTYAVSIAQVNLKFCLFPEIKVDLVVQPVPEPLPALSTCSQDQELDVTMDVITTPLSENTQPDTEQEVGRTEQGTSAQGEEKYHEHTNP